MTEAFPVQYQFSCSVVSNSLWPHEPQHTRPPCPSPTPRVDSNPCAFSRWCHPTISSSFVPFSSCPQSFPASGSSLFTIYKIQTSLVPWHTYSLKPCFVSLSQSHYPDLLFFLPTDMLYIYKHTYLLSMSFTMTYASWGQEFCLEFCLLG